MSADVSYLDEILRDLERLDGLLRQAVATAQAAYGQAASADPYRGLYIGKEEIERLLTRKPGGLTLRADGAADEAATSHSSDRPAWVARLQRGFTLSRFDVDVILIALASELDSRYERLYAYLQDDVTRKRPTVDLALNLLCVSFEEKLQRRADFAPDAPLLQNSLLHLIPEPHQAQPALLSHYLSG